MLICFNTNSIFVIDTVTEKRQAEQLAKQSILALCKGIETVLVHIYKGKETALFTYHRSLKK